MICFWVILLINNKCLLAHRVINPLRRGKGIAAIVIKVLCKHRQLNLSVTDGSLFVYKNNLAALPINKKLGFTVAANAFKLAILLLAR